MKILMKIHPLFTGTTNNLNHDTKYPLITCIRCLFLCSKVMLLAILGLQAVVKYYDAIIAAARYACHRGKL